MGTNCGCIQAIREDEIRIQLKDSLDATKISPETVAIYEQGFMELMSSLPIFSPDVKASTGFYIGKINSVRTFSI